MIEHFPLFTTAPQDYDYGCNAEELPIAGHYDDKPVRLINCHSQYHCDYQMGRYQSGMYFTRGKLTIGEDVKHGHFVPTEECITLMKKWGFDAIFS